MQSEWMGRYEGLIKSLVKHVNIISSGNAEKSDFGDGILLTPISWQALEFAVQHSDSNCSLTDIARTLGIPQSTFSKAIKLLASYNLVEKYMATNNKKNVILRPTEKGKKFFYEYDNSVNKKYFEEFMSMLDGVSDENIALFEKALSALTDGLPPKKKQDEIYLIKKQD